MRPSIMTTAPIRKSHLHHRSNIEEFPLRSRGLGYYLLCLLVLLSLAATTTVSAYCCMVLPTTRKSPNRLERRTSTMLYQSTPTNPPSNNNIIEDDEDAKIFAALSSPTTSPLIEEDDEMMIANTDATYTGTVDWDQEWKEVMKKEKSGGLASTFIPKNKTNRPGSDYYKSDAEIAAIRAANEVTKKATKLASNVASTTSSMTDWNTIKYDWKVWIGVLAVLSFGTAFLTAIPQSEPIASTESYFI